LEGDRQVLTNYSLVRALLLLPSRGDACLRRPGGKYDITVKGQLLHSPLKPLPNENKYLENASPAIKPSKTTIGPMGFTLWYRGRDSTSDADWRMIAPLGRLGIEECLTNFNWQGEASFAPGDYSDGRRRVFEKFSVQYGSEVLFTELATYSDGTIIRRGGEDSCADLDSLGQFAALPIPFHGIGKLSGHYDYELTW
jgi:hypothetical protein